MTCLALASALRNPLLSAVGQAQTPTAAVLGLPHAGGTCRLFRGWERLLPQDTQLLALRYPGREARLTHAPFRRMSDLVEQILSATLFLEDMDLYLFGHSMGALVGYAVCQEMKARGRRAPSGLVVSSSRPPWGTPESAPIRTRSEAGLCEELLALDGTPPEILKDPATRDLVLSPLRADYELLETWTPMEGPIDSPIHEIHGDADTLTEDDVNGWRCSTTRGSAKSMGGCLISSGSGVLMWVRRDPHGDDEGVYSIPSPARSRRQCHPPPRPPCRASPWSRFSGTWLIPGTVGACAMTCPRYCPWPSPGCWPAAGA